MRKKNTNDPANNLPPISHLPCRVLKAIADAALLSHNFDSAYDYYAILGDKTYKKRNIYHYHALRGLSHVLLHENRNYDTALSFLYEAIRVIEQQKPFPKQELNIGLAYFDIGATLSLMEDYNQSLSYYYRSKEILEKYDESPDLARCYNDIVYVLCKLGEGKKAIEIAQMALQESKKTNLYRSILIKCFSLPDTQAIARQNLVRVLDSNKDNLDEALRLSYHAIEAQQDSSQNDVAWENTFFGLVKLYQNLNDYEKALSFAQKALDLCKTQKGLYHVDTGRAYLYIAECYLGLDKKQYPKALSSAQYYAQNAYDILTSSKQPNNLSQAEVCIILSELYLSKNALNAAAGYIRDGLQAAKLTVDNDHQTVLALYEMLSDLHYKRGYNNLALSYSEHILSRKRNGAAESLYDLLHSCYRAAFMAERSHDKQKKVRYAQELMQLITKAPNAILNLPQERLRLLYLRRIKVCIEQCYSIAMSNSGGIDPAALYDFALKSNNINAEIQFHHTNYYRSEANPQIRSAYRALITLQTMHHNLMAEDSPNEEALLESAQKIEIAEIHLVKQLEYERIKNPFESVSAANVQSALQQGEMLIEFVRYKGVDWRPYRDGVILVKKDRYCAFLVTKDTINAIDLSDGEKTDSLIIEICRKIKGLEPCEEQLQKVYELLLGQFDQDLVGVDKIYIVPDGNLYRLPFELLIRNDGQALYLSADISYLSSGRELLRKHCAPSKNPSISIIADPLFDLSDSIDANERSIHLSDDNHLRSMGGDINLRAEKIVPLPFTGVEADEIASLFPNKSSVIKGVLATKYSIPVNNGAEFLHIATHGFAFQEEIEEDESANLTRGLVRGARFEKADDPLQRYGLLFAGAKTWWQGKRLPEKFGNGVLTGNDILGMNLSQYKMLVLSACETGLGEMRSGEGIKGLRHSFELAGVASLICTLWEVDDLTSSVLMYKFYDELARDEMHDIPQALNKAKQFMRQMTAEELYLFLQERGFSDDAIVEFEDIGYFSAEHPFALPYFWAGFIYQGTSRHKNNCEPKVDDGRPDESEEDLEQLTKTNLEFIEQQYEAHHFLPIAAPVNVKTAVETDRRENKPIVTKIILLLIVLLFFLPPLLWVLISSCFPTLSTWEVDRFGAGYWGELNFNMQALMPSLFIIFCILVIPTSIGLLLWWQKEIKASYEHFLSKLHEGKLKATLTRAPRVLDNILKVIGSFLMIILNVLNKLMPLIYIVLAFIIVRIAIKTIRLVMLVFF